jgi:hypothetical protein
MAEGLAGITAREDVNWRDCRPIHLGDVSEIWDALVMRGQYLARCGFDLGVPDDIADEDRLYGHVEAAVAGEQGADAGHAAPPERFLAIGVDTVSTVVQTVDTGKQPRRTP